MNLTSITFYTIHSCSIRDSSEGWMFTKLLSSLLNVMFSFSKRSRCGLDFGIHSTRWMNWKLFIMLSVATWPFKQQWKGRYITSFTSLVCHCCINYAKGWCLWVYMWYNALIVDWVWENLSYLSTCKFWPHFQGLKFNNFFSEHDAYLKFLPLMHQSLEGRLKFTELL